MTCCDRNKLFAADGVRYRSSPNGSPSVDAPQFAAGLGIKCEEQLPEAPEDQAPSGA